MKDDIDQLIRSINDRLGFAGREPWTTIDGHNVATVGMVVKDSAYGAVGASIVLNESGVERQLFGGRTTKHELIGKLRAYLDGFDAAKKIASGRKLVD